MKASKSGFIAKDVEFTRSALGSGHLIIPLLPEPAPLAKPQQVVVRKAQPKASPAVVMPKMAPTKSKHQGQDPSLWGWLTLGTGGALILAGTGTWFGAISRSNDVNSGSYASTAAYDKRWDDQVKPLATASYVLWGLGGATALTGGLLLWLDGDRARTSKARRRALPRVFAGPIPGGAAFSVTTAF